MKNNSFFKWCLSSILMVFLIFLYTQMTSTAYTLHPNSERKVIIKGNSESLDSVISVTITSKTNDGKIKLICGDSWVDTKEDIHYNIITSQIEKWNYDSASGKSTVMILQNPLNGIEVDEEGISINTPKDATFSFQSKKDFTVRIKNLSDKNVSVEVNVVYR